MIGALGRVVRGTRSLTLSQRYDGEWGLPVPLPKREPEGVFERRSKSAEGRDIGDIVYTGR